MPGGQAKLVTRATQNVRQGQAGRSGLAGRGGPVAQGQGSARAMQQPSVPGIKKESPAAQSSTTPEVILHSMTAFTHPSFGRG